MLAEGATPYRRKSLNKKGLPHREACLAINPSLVNIELFLVQRGVGLHDHRFAGEFFHI